MRKFFISLLILFTLFIQLSCGKKDVQHNGPADQTNMPATSSTENHQSKESASPSSRASRSPQIDTGKTGGLQKKRPPANH